MNRWTVVRTCRMRLTRASVFMAAVIGIVGLGACGNDDDTAAGADGKALEQVSFRFDVTASGYVSPFLLAAEKGWYADEGLEVEFGEGTGSITTIQVVASGKDTFGWADFGTLMGLVDKDAKVKAVSIIGQQSPLAIVSSTDAGITNPEDLEGRRLLWNPRGASSPLFRALAEAEGIDMSDIDLITASADANNATLLARDRVDAVVSWETFDLPAIRELGVDPEVLPFRDYGVDPMNVSIVASDSTIEEDPEVVRAFVAASRKGWAYAAKHPQEAIDVLLESYPNNTRSIATAQLEGQLELLHTERSEGKPLGWAAREDVEATQQVLLETKQLGTERPAGEYYTNEFIEKE